ncbi:MAG TPA: hypothetical protein VIM55_01110 [Mucilaginibacter sp.]
MATYTINFVNNSNSGGNFCVFQQNHNSPNPGVFSLAWLSQFANPHSKLPISWNTDSYFFWAKTGALAPGVIFNAGEALQAGMTENNEVTLTKRDGNYKFTGLQTWFQQGTLRVTSDANTAINQASVGIGMSGSGTFAVQAQPNMTFHFSPAVDYWVTFGDFKQGQVLNPSDLGRAVKIDFPHGIFSMNATLNPDNTWTITPGLD